MRRNVLAMLRTTVACTLAFTLAVPAWAGARTPAPFAGAAKGVTGSARGVAGRTAYVPDEVIVRFGRSTTASQRTAAHHRAGGASSRGLGTSVPGLMRVRLRSGVDVADAVAAYRRQPGVLYAQPNYIKRIETVPTDPRFSELWGMSNTGQSGGTPDADIDAPEAWSVTTGSQEVTIAVIDTGVDYGHPELSANVWTNPGEIAGNGRDDDGNGYIDDVHGWDTVNNDGDPMDDNGHGTHVSGTIGASANNGVGVAGVNWRVKIVGIKMLDQSGSGTSADEIEAFEYAKAVGAKVISCSWGGYSTAVDAVEYQEIQSLDALVVCAAGNESNDNDMSRVDTVGGANGYHYPSSYDLPNIVAVGATDRNDLPADFSNHGATSVDLFAPGVAILSTIPGSRLVNTDQAVFSDAMGSLANWSVVHVDGATTNPWVLSADRFTSTPSSAGNRNYLSGGWDGLELTNGLDLAAAGAPGYALTFKTWLDVENDDTFWIWAISNERTWGLVGYGTGATNGFVNADLDLTEYASDTGVRVSFDLDSLSTDASSANGEGVYVDDVKIVKKQAVVDYPNAYAAWDGTSMATPHVSGAAALLLSVDPGLSVAEMRSALLGSVDTKTSLNGMCVTGGRLNLARAVQAVQTGATAQGTVTAGGVGLGGVTVSSGTESTVTAANGGYRLTGLEAGTQTIRFEKPHYKPQTRQATLVFGASVTVDASLSPADGAIAGSVRDAKTHAPVSGVRVSAAGTSTTTAGDGSYAITGVAPGSYTMTFTRAAYADGAANAAVTSDATETVDVDLVPDPGTVAGVVRSDGVPLPGVLVTLGARTTTTGQDGSYTIANLAPGDYQLTFSKAHYASTTGSASVASYQTTLLDASLVAHPGAVAGVVTSAAGAPLAGATVVIGGISATTGSDGSYTVAGIKPGTYAASFTMAGYVTGAVSVNVYSDFTTPLYPSLAVLTGSVNGVVTDNGVPVAGALVVVGERTAITAANGTYAVGGLVPGPYTFLVVKSGYVAASGGVAVAGGSASSLNVALSRVVKAASVAKSPSKTSLTYRRKRGVAKFKLAATFKGWGGQALSRRTVYLQTSKNGRTGWKSTYKLTTGSTGKASKSFKLKTRGTRYYRWYVPARSRVNLKTYAAKQKIVVK